MNFRLFEIMERRGQSHGPLTGDDEVEVVSQAPTGFVRVVERLTLHNADTAAVTVILIMVDESGPTPTNVEATTALAAGANYDFATTARPINVPEGFHLEMVMSADPSANQPNWLAAYKDVPLSDI